MELKYNILECIRYKMNQMNGVMPKLIHLDFDEAVELYDFLYPEHKDIRDNDKVEIMDGKVSIPFQGMAQTVNIEVD